MGYVKRDSIQWIIGQVFEGWMTPEEKRCKAEFQRQLDALPDENVVPVSVRPEQEGCSFCRNHEEDEEPVKEDITKDCRTCGYGRYNDHWGQCMCHDPDPTGHGCVEWSHWIPKEDYLC